MKSVFVKSTCLGLLLVCITGSEGLAQTSPRKPKSCVVGVNSILRQLTSNAKQCTNAKDNVVPLKSQRTNVLSGSADDLFSLALDRIVATEDELSQIAAAEKEIQSKRDSLLEDLDGAIQESVFGAEEICKQFTSKTGEYNQAVATCSKARKKSVTLSCRVSLRYGKRDAAAAKDRCDGVTRLATNIPRQQTSNLSEIDALLAKYRAQLAKENTDADEKELKAAIEAATAERAKQSRYFESAIGVINGYKSTACSESATILAAYSKLVKDCAKK